MHSLIARRWLAHAILVSVVPQYFQAEIDRYLVRALLLFRDKKGCAAYNITLRRAGIDRAFGRKSVFTDSTLPQCHKILLAYYCAEYAQSIALSAAKLQIGFGK